MTYSDKNDPMPASACLMRRPSFYLFFPWINRRSTFQKVDRRLSTNSLNWRQRRRRQRSMTGWRQTTHRWPPSPPPSTSIERIGRQPAIHLWKGLATVWKVDRRTSTDSRKINVDGSGDGGQWRVIWRLTSTHHWPPSPLPSTSLERISRQPAIHPFERWITGRQPIQGKTTLTAAVTGVNDGLSDVTPSLTPVATAVWWNISWRNHFSSIILFSTTKYNESFKRWLIW